MPQIQILPEAPGFGSQFGEALGGGISKGIEQGISTRLSDMLQRKKEFGKLDKYTKAAFGTDWPVNSEDQLAAIKRTREYFNQGYSPQDAVLMSRYHDELSALEAPSQQAQKAQAEAKEPSLSQRLSGREDVVRETKKLGQKVAYPFVQLADYIRQATSPSVAAEADLKRQGFSPEEIAQSRQEIQKDLPGPLRGEPPQSMTEQYLKATGGVGPGENVLERAGQAWLVGGVPAVVGELGGEFVGALGGGPKAQEAANVIGFVGALLSGRIKGSISKNILKRAEKVAAQTGRTVEDVIGKAAQESGASLEGVAKGEAGEINKLNRRITSEAPKVAEKVAATEKTVFNLKQAMRERAAFGSKLPESPFKHYFKTEAEKAAVEASKRPETLAKDAANRAKIEPQIESKTADLSLKRQQLKDLERDVKSLQGAEKGRVETNIHYKRKEIEKTLEELKDLNYEIRYNRKRPTEVEMDAQVKKSANEIVEEARNPTAEGQKKIQKQLKDDADYLARAEKLVARGELPGEIRPDTHIKMKQKYIDGYNAMISELREANKTLQGSKDAASLKQLADNKRAIDRFQTRLKRLKGDVVIQTDKIKAMKAIEGPSGAFYRNQIKSLRNDVAEFQKDFFSQPKVKRPETLKAEKVGGQEIKKAGEQAEKVGISQKEIKAIADEIKPSIEKAANAENASEGIAGVKKEIEKATEQLMKKAPKSAIKRYIASRAREALARGIIYTISGGGAVTLYQLFNKYRFAGDKKDYLNTKDARDRRQLELKWRSKGYSPAKIKNIMRAAEAEKQLKKI